VNTTAFKVDGLIDKYRALTSEYAEAHSEVLRATAEHAAIMERIADIMSGPDADENTRIVERRRAFDKAKLVAQRRDAARAKRDELLVKIDEFRFEVQLKTELTLSPPSLPSG
jgi:ABC-type nitrate/sulfonate/bicarbonate transport system substrate-binding protein